MPDISIADAVRGRISDVVETPTALLEALYALADDFDQCLERIDSPDDLYDVIDGDRPVTDSTTVPNADLTHSKSPDSDEISSDFPQPST